MNWRNFNLEEAVKKHLTEEKTKQLKSFTVNTQHLHTLVTIDTYVFVSNKPIPNTKLTIKQQDDVNIIAIIKDKNKNYIGEFFNGRDGRLQFEIKGSEENDEVLIEVYQVGIHKEVSIRHFDIKQSILQA